MVLFVISFAMIVPGDIIVTEKTTIWALLCNLGYGVFGSAIVALLIDFANTKMKNENDAKKMKVLSGKYRNAFLDLRDSVLSVAEYRYGTDGKKRTFYDWIDYVLAPVDAKKETNEEVEENVYEMKYEIIELKKASSALGELLLMNLDNEKNTAQYRQSINNVCAISSNLLRILEDYKFPQAAEIIKKRLTPKFLKFHEEYSELFTKPYDEDRYAES